MTNDCARCNQTHPMERMLTIVNAYHNGPHWIDVCQDCTQLGDRVVGPDDVNADLMTCSRCDAECSGH